MNLNALLGYNSLSLFYLCRSNFSTVATLLTFSSFFEEGEKKSQNRSKREVAA